MCGGCGRPIQQNERRVRCVWVEAAGKGEVEIKPDCWLGRGQVRRDLECH